MLGRERLSSYEPTPYSENAGCDSDVSTKEVCSCLAHVHIWRPQRDYRRKLAPAEV